MKFKQGKVFLNEVEFGCTMDYGRFKVHDLNRDEHEDKYLEETMQKYGFIPGVPIYCKRDKNGKLKIFKGHHRFHFAKRFKLPIWYVVYDCDITIEELEMSTKQAWSNNDFFTGRVKGGDKDCVTLHKFRKEHGLSLKIAASLVGGQSATSSNKIRDIKAGIFKAGDQTFGNKVTTVTDLCRELKIPFGTSAAFASAVSMAIRIPEFDIDLFCHRIKTHPVNMQKRGRTDEYLEEIEALYNFGSRGKTKLPVKFLAIKVGKERQRNFGDKK